MILKSQISNLQSQIEEMSSEIEKPKIIIDEDWKSQVEAEKSAARSGGTDSTTSSAAQEPTGSRTTRSAAEPPDATLPPATFSFLLTTIATQAMIALGQVPNPITGKIELRPQQAKHYIDALAMLEEKTANNRTPDETTLLTEILHQLRMGYVLLLNSMPSAG